MFQLRLHIKYPPLTQLISQRQTLKLRVRTVLIFFSEFPVQRQACKLKPVRKHDTPSYTLQTFIPDTARDAYLSVRAFNIELARIPDVVSNPTISTLRMQFWRDNINQTLEGRSTREPISILLHHALASLSTREANFQAEMIKAWFHKVINTREKYLDNRPYVSLDALETYAENTYSNLLYITLAALPVHSLMIDHIASHIGKANGITAVLRGVPLIAFPQPWKQDSNNLALGAAVSEKFYRRREAVMLPLDVMIEAGIKEEEVFRQGSAAPGLKDAVFTVATRANDHLITARDMIKKIKLCEDVGHDYEHSHDESYYLSNSESKSKSAKEEFERSFGVLMPAIATQLWLDRLEKLDFDLFRPELRVRDWKLPWKSFWAYHRKAI